MLRPSKFQLSSADSENAGNSLLKPSKFTANNLSEDSNSGSNPFFKASNNTSVDDDSSNAFGTTPARMTDEGKSDENADPLSKLNRSSAALPKSNLFSVKSTISDNSGFVFGQNISDRVTGTGATTKNHGGLDGIKEVDEDGDTAANTTTVAAGSDDGVCGSSSSNNHSHAAVAGGSVVGPLFSVAAVAMSTTCDVLEKKEVDGQSLLEATKKYEERCKVQKRKYEEVATKTGEEGERNICEINCKIFAFVASNYEERGRGMLRLNDAKTNPMVSRVVFRMSGNHRVLVNTKVSGKLVPLPIFLMIAIFYSGVARDDSGKAECENSQDDRHRY